MSDKDKIAELRELYAIYFDNRDAEAFLTIFADDGVMVVPGSKEIIGHERLARLVSSIPANGGKHIPIDAEISVNGDEASCNGPYRMELAGEVHTGQYDDQFVRTSAGWRFSKRVILPNG
jgi:ketosteroid isomerase-like protein